MSFGQIQHIGILGGCGGFGRVFADKISLLNVGVRVTRIDISESADLICDIYTQPEVLQGVARELDVLLMCVPERLALDTLYALDGTTGTGLLVVDICSVKSNIVQAATGALHPSEYVSIHPMFGPDRGFEQNNLVYIDVRGDKIAANFRSLLSKLGVNIVDTDAARHDEITSMVQALAHATLVSFAAAQQQLQEKLKYQDSATSQTSVTSQTPVTSQKEGGDLINAMATPIYRALSQTAQGLLGENPTLYHNIQTANPNSQLARDVLLKAVTETMQILGEPNEAGAKGVVELFDSLKDTSPMPSKKTSEK